MNSNIVNKYAELLVNYSLRVKKGDKVYIKSTYLAEDLVNAVIKCILKIGAYYETKILLKDSDKIFYENASDDVLKYVSQSELNIYKTFDCMLTIRAPFDTKELANINSEKKKMRQVALSSFSKIFSKRSAKASLRWALCQYPTLSSANDANMSLEEYENFVCSSCFLYSDDASKKWQEISSMQEKLCSYLNSKSKITIICGKTNITYLCKNRVWINSDGKRNMPSGEVFTTPIENSVNGILEVSFPFLYMGKQVEGLCLTMKNGKVSNFSATKGEDLLRQIFSISGSNVFGESAIATNYGIKTFTNNILFDEKMGGTVHFALGDSYGETGGKNRSAIHIDLICDLKKNGKIYADDVLFYENGNILENIIK